jgi:hypothetical protein
VLFIFRIVIFVNTLSTHFPFIFRSQFHFSEISKLRVYALKIKRDGRLRESSCWNLVFPL